MVKELRKMGVRKKRLQEKKKDKEEEEAEGGFYFGLQWL